MEVGSEMSPEAEEVANLPESSEDWNEAQTGQRLKTVMNEPKVRDALTLASFAGLTFGAAALGSVANRKSLGIWYSLLRKPPFQPPRWVFAPVWTALYGLIAASGYRVWKAPSGKERNRALALWGTQLALNTAWSPLFFGARRPRAALVDLVAMLGVVGAYAGTSRKVDKAAAAMMGPYLAWLAFAGLLNEEIVRRNRGIRRYLAR